MSRFAAFRMASVCVCAAFGFAARLQAGSAVFTPVEDTTITEKFSGDPQGTSGDLTVGTNGKGQSSRPLLRFNFAGSIPSNAVITFATLTIQVTAVAPGIPPAVTLNLRKMLRAWSESSATWTVRLPATPWSINGAAAPVDFVSAVTQGISVSDTGPHTFASNAGMVADVQDWVRNPGSNCGWIMISESQGIGQTESKSSSREGGNAPSLVVQYTVPPAAPTLKRLPLAAGQFRFSFDAESNHNYAVEYNNTPAASNWNILTNIAPLPAATNVMISDTLTESNRFYRVWTP